MSEDPLRALFRADVEACGRRIEELLATLAGDAAAAQRFAAIARDVHAVAAGARILGLAPAIRLAAAVARVADAGAQGNVAAVVALAEPMVAAMTLLARIAAASEHLDGWMSKYGAVVDEAEAALALPQPQHVPPPAATAPRPESSPPGASDASLLAIFAAEVERQVVLAGDALLALERNPSERAALETLLRAAHSVKGAARVVRLEALVGLTHELEECFVACHAGRLTLGGDAFDLLLRAVDAIRQLAHAAPATLPARLAERAAVLEALTAALARLRTSGAGAQPLASARLDGQAPAAAPSADKGEPVLRIAAENLNRIMALASETVVESGWLDPFVSSLTTLKRRQLELAELIDQSRTVVVDGGQPQLVAKLLHEARQKMLECQQALSDRLSDLGTFSLQSASLSARLYNEVLDSRMRPFADGTRGLPRLVRDLARQLGKRVKLELGGEKTRIDRDVLDALEAPLVHLVRNALDHGLESPEERVAAGKSAEGLLRIDARHRAGTLSISVTDDGRGIDFAALRARVVERGLAHGDMVERLSEAELSSFLFLPGFSLAKQVTELSGRGVGLDAVQTAVRQIGGIVRVEPRAQCGLSLQLQLPITRSVMRSLLVEIAGETFAFPLVRVDRIVRVAASAVESLEDRQYFDFDGSNVGLVAAHQVLQLAGGEPRDELLVAVISNSVNRYGLVVDRFLGERDLVVQPLDPRLSKVPDVAAAAIMQDGTPVVILDVDDLVRSIESILDGTRLRKVTRLREAAKRKRILLIDDSITVREVARRLLENAGYAVDVAVDGIDGWNAARSGRYDLVVTDVDMPRMSGIDLITRIRGDARLASLPVVIVSYKDREEDRRLGLGAGANKYLGKGSVHDATLAHVVAELIGAAA